MNKDSNKTIMDKYLTWKDAADKILSATIEELPEYLTHEDELIRAHAGARLQTLQLIRSKNSDT